MNCPICGKETVFWGEIKNSPLLQNVLFDKVEDALSARKVDVNFYYCEECDFLYNPSFISDVEYGAHYNNDQVASAEYREYLSNLVRLLKDKLNNIDNVLEIGCGNGFFLDLINKTFMPKNIAGFDPSYGGQYAVGIADNSYFYASKINFKVDLVIMRHMIEQALYVDELMDNIDEVLKSDGKIYIEITNFNYIKKNQALHMLFHECYYYHSTMSIQKIMKRYGYILDEAFPLFNGNYLGLIFSRGQFDTRAVDKKSELLSTIRQYKKVVVWGCGGRTISFINSHSLTNNEIQYGVDIDSKKQQKYIPIAGIKIISASECLTYAPDLVIIANPIYAQEIKQYFSAGGYCPDFVCL